MTKRDNEYSQLEDFLTDDEFKRWVLTKDPKLNAFWEKWMATHLEKKPTVLKAREMLLAMQFDVSEVTDSEKDQILEQVLKGQKSFPAQGRTRKVNEFSLNTYTKWWGRIVASIMLIFCVFIFVKVYEFRKMASNIAKEVKTITKSIPKGQKLSLMLPDGSRVYLNSESSISFPEKFDGQSRAIKLTGEAYFDVIEDQSRPFIVQTNNISTEVLGTSFNVNSFPEDDEVIISLVSGKVKVLNNNPADNKPHEVVLEKGEKITINKTTYRMVKTTFDVISEVGWKKGVLTFNNADFEQIKKKLERWYDVRISCSDEALFKGWDVDGQFTDQSLEWVLNHLSYSKRFTFKIDGKNVYLDKNQN